MKTNNSTFLLGLDNPGQAIRWLNEHKETGGLIFLGRSNVGKSTLINQLFLKGIARVSKTPGRTQQINVFEMFGTHLFDCPGMGHAEVPPQMRDNWDKLMLAFFQNLSARHVCIHLMDARHPFMPADEELLDFFKKMKIRPIMVFCKTDKLKTQKEKNELKKLRTYVMDKYKKVSQIHFISSLKREGTEELKDALFLKLSSIH